MKSILFVLFLVACVSAERTFEIRNQTFYKDGQPFQYVSGSFHYFRVHPDRWEDVFRKMAAGGLNAVQTYIAWNLHEPYKGQFNFEGIADIDRWLKLAEKYNMAVIMRPGPYICAEWDFGGLPYWLVKEEGMVIRTDNKPYMDAVDAWYDVLLPIFKPHMYVNGGSIISVQVENEYGFYDKCNKVYMKHLAAKIREHLGDDAILFTVDTYSDSALTCGNVEGVYMTVDFGTGHTKEAYDMQRKYEQVYPLVNTEFYPGWLDHWEEKHHTVSTEAVVSSMEEMLNMGGNVNYYMYIGGTNFAFYAGANGDRNSYQSDPTSYDYDAPLSEAADLTHKWEAIRDSIKKYREVPELEVHNTTKRSYGHVEFKYGLSFWDALETLSPKPVHATSALSFEELDIPFGYVMYTAKTQGGMLKLPTIHDRAYVYVNRQFVKLLTRTGEKETSIPAGELEIIVENMGRINFGSDMFEKKGLPEGVYVEGEAVEEFEIYCIPMDNVEKLPFSAELPKTVPAFFKTEFLADEADDTFLNPEGWAKGVAWVNGFNLGRYWTVGPQLTLYVPGPVLKKGLNELIVFEAERIGTEGMELQSVPVIDI